MLPEKKQLEVSTILYQAHGDNVSEPNEEDHKKAAEKAIDRLKTEGSWSLLGCCLKLPKDSVVLVQNGKLISPKNPLIPDVEVSFVLDEKLYLSKAEIKFEALRVDSLTEFFDVDELTTFVLPKRLNFLGTSKHINFQDYVMNEEPFIRKEANFLYKKRN